MPDEKSKRIRLSQTLTPYGVGAILDITGESFVATDIRRWENQGQRISLARLEKVLERRHFRSAPVASAESWRNKVSIAGVPFRRFPGWLFCQRCRRMVKWQTNAQNLRCDNSKCAGRGKARLVPMRWIAICRNGHMSDIRWEKLAHLDAKTESQKQCADNKNLIFTSRQGSGLSSLIVKCNTCKAQCDIESLYRRIGEIFFQCPSKQPWEYLGDKEFRDRRCSEHCMVVQRGSSNVHFPIIVSALDIPPESNYSQDESLRLRIVNSKGYELLVDLFKTAPDGPLVPGLIRTIASREEVAEAELRGILERDCGNVLPVNPERDMDNLRIAEWRAFLTPSPATNPRDGFVTRETDFTSSGSCFGSAADVLLRFIDRVVIATRLREVRVLRGFCRVEPNPDKMVPADLDESLPWLPAIEVFGEGIFIKLNDLHLSHWLQNPEVQARTCALPDRRNRSNYRAFLPEPTPRFVMLHTLAHLLIRSLAFHSGYPAASMRERIYSFDSSDSAESMAGVLIYTAAGDCEGSLGGLARMGEPKRLVPVFVDALQKARWCSSDPVCSEVSGQGNDGLNLAACHACALVSETSCEYANCLLDRSTVVSHGDSSSGCFDGFLAEIDLMLMAREAGK